MKLIKPVRLIMTMAAIYVLGIFTYKVGYMAYLTYFRRGNGAIGGEIFIIPFMLLLFYIGWEAKSFYLTFKSSNTEDAR